MKPLNTFASELLRKVSKSDTYKELSADQVLISITKNPILWYNVPLIYLNRGNDSIRNVIGIDKNQKYASFIDFFDDEGNYKISEFLEKASEGSDSVITGILDYILSVSKTQHIKMQKDLIAKGLI